MKVMNLEVEQTTPFDFLTDASLRSRFPDIQQADLPLLLTSEDPETNLFTAFLLGMETLLDPPTLIFGHT
jgi:hypothetical protein